MWRLLSTMCPVSTLRPPSGWKDQTSIGINGQNVGCHNEGNFSSTTILRCPQCPHTTVTQPAYTFLLLFSLHTFALMQVKVTWLWAVCYKDQIMYLLTLHYATWSPWLQPFWWNNGSHKTTQTIGNCRVRHYLTFVRHPVPCPVSSDHHSCWVPVNGA